MRVASLFSGIGGFDLGLERVGMTVTAQLGNAVTVPVIEWLGRRIMDLC